MEDIIEINLHYIDPKGNETSFSQTRTILEDDEDGLETLCNCFLNFVRSAGYDYVKDIKVGIDENLM